MKRGRADAETRYQPIAPPVGKHLMPALEGEANELESAMLADLDRDRLHQLAECLFTLNNRRFGPVPGAYVVMCVEPGKRWCVGQLSADRARPVRLFEELMFGSAAAARRAAERLRRTRGEVPPVRSI